MITEVRCSDSRRVELSDDCIHAFGNALYWTLKDHCFGYADKQFVCISNDIE